MQLTKHHGWGNDFLVAFAAEEPLGAPELARRLCDRHRGIGADGLVLGLPGAPGSPAPSVATFVLLNADGSRAEVSGNGLRCFGQALALRDLVTGEAAFEVDTVVGRRQITVAPTSDPTVVDASVAMGSVTPSDAPDLDRLRAAVGGPRWDGLGVVRVARADIGNPHVVLAVADPEAVPIREVGPAVESLLGPINVHLVGAPAADGAVPMVIWERGAGVTQACGSGACVVAHTARSWGWAHDEVSVAMPGGTAVVRLTGDHATLVGPAQHIATIETPHG